MFLSEAELRMCTEIRDKNRSDIGSHACDVAHAWWCPTPALMLWSLASKRYPGDPIDVVYGSVDKIVGGHVLVKGKSGISKLEADHILVQRRRTFFARHSGPIAGATRIFLSGLSRPPDGVRRKDPVATREHFAIRLMPQHGGDGCAAQDLCMEVDGIKTGLLIFRPALDLSLKAITGPARYILSDLRNDPLSIKKFMQLLSNPDAVKEAILFKMKAGFPAAIATRCCFWESSGQRILAAFP